jgi:hypothetical protein
MVTCCGRLFGVQTENVLNFFELLTRARAPELCAALLYQAVRVDVPLAGWLLG